MDFDPTAIRCYAFGAPPVLSLSEKTAAQNVMSVRTYLLSELLGTTLFDRWHSNRSMVTVLHSNSQLCATVRKIFSMWY